MEREAVQGAPALQLRARGGRSVAQADRAGDDHRSCRSAAGLRGHGPLLRARAIGRFVKVFRVARHGLCSCNGRDAVVARSQRLSRTGKRQSGWSERRSQGGRQAPADDSFDGDSADKTGGCEGKRDWRRSGAGSAGRGCSRGASALSHERGGGAARQGSKRLDAGLRGAAACADPSVQNRRAAARGGLEQFARGAGAAAAGREGRRRAHGCDTAAAQHPTLAG